MYISRHIYKYIQKMTEQFKVVLITGSRQVGKSTLVNKELSIKYECIVLDDFMV